MTVNTFTVLTDIPQRRDSFHTFSLQECTSAKTTYYGE